MKAAVLYKSKTGFVKKYAGWIAQELSADLFEVSKVKIGMLTPYDTIVYGGSLHAVGIIGLKFIKKNLDKLGGKKLAVFASGASPARPEVVKQITSANFTPDQQKLIKVFYMRGGFNYDKLPFFDKVIMSLMKRRIMNKKKKGLTLTPDETGMLAAYDKPVDFTRKKYIEELVAYIKS